jgi:adenosylcobyric acid synthase
VDLRLIGSQEAAPGCDLIILPGSKNVRADLAWLRENGWEEIIHRHLRYGGKLLGICGGFQLLGRAIHDPYGIEGMPGKSDALNLLNMETTLEREKQLRNTNGTLTFGSAPVRGYEIHAGVTRGPALSLPMMHLAEGPDGAISADGQIMGTYLHGLFEEPAACDVLLKWAGFAGPKGMNYGDLREAGIDCIADALEAHADLDGIFALFMNSGSDGREKERGMK